MKPASRQLTSLIIALAMLVLATWLDCWTGFEVSVFFLYIIPVVWATWFLDLSAGLWLGALSTIAHRWSDWAVGSHFSRPWVFWERGLSSFVILAFIAFSFHIFKRGRKTDRERIEQLETLLKICPACDRVDQTDGGRKNLADCLREHPVPPAEQRLCPDCAALRHQGRDSL